MKEKTVNKIKEVMLSGSKLNLSEGIGFLYFNSSLDSL